MGSHLLQIYILETTLQYILRELKKAQNQIKFEPPDSPVRTNLNEAIGKLRITIKSNKKEIKNMSIVLNKVSLFDFQFCNVVEWYIS